MSDSRPIGIFDSGLGGLSILKEVRRQLPRESILYFADQGRLPYGPRPVSEIRQFSDQITRFLLERGAKVIVVACNTASAAALAHLRQTFPHAPFVGMEPAVKPAAEQTKSRVVGVIATQATCQSELFASVVDRFAQGVAVLTKACPGLVMQVEAGEFESPRTHKLLHEYLDPLIADGIDSLVLACTHYSFLIPAIQHIVGPTVAIVDPAPAVARQVGRILDQRQLLNTESHSSILAAFTSGAPSNQLAALMLGEQIDFEAVAAETLPNPIF
ncbi:MAG: glutamate racemase [Chloroflexi bacterium]|nr:glutamate racemase [Chloroflexota bacterium]